MEIRVQGESQSQHQETKCWGHIRTPFEISSLGVNEEINLILSFDEKMRSALAKTPRLKGNQTVAVYSLDLIL